MKYLTMGLLFIGITALVSCKKEDMSKYVTKDELSQGQVSSDPKIENIDLTIKPYEWTWNSLYKCWEYKYPHSSIYQGVLVGYVMNGQGKQFMPYYDAQTGVTYGLADETFSGNIRITYYDGTTSLQKPSYDKYVYLKIIPSAGLKTHPNLDLTNYEEVSKVFKVE
ncbi:MAG: hypothetical protein M9897_11350 [Brumimicrobium sp.]|nr:hypothetical protein [Brumimicrobium sp.]